MPTTQYFIAVDFADPSGDRHEIVEVDAETYVRMQVPRFNGTIGTAVLRVDPASTAATTLPWESPNEAPVAPPKSRAQRRAGKRK